MRRQTDRSSFNISSWYIGSGNKVSVFTRRPHKPFAKIKEIYGDELERLKNDKQNPHLTFKTLSKEEKQEIRTRLKRQLNKERKKKIIDSMISILITASIIVAIYYIVKLNF